MKSGARRRRRHRSGGGCGVFSQPLPFSAQRAVPVHQQSADRQQRNGQACCRPNQLHTQSPIRSEMQGYLRPDDPVAQALIDAVPPDAQMRAGVRAEVNRVLLFASGAIAPPHADCQRRTATERKVNPAQPGPGIDGIRPLNQAGQVGRRPCLLFGEDGRWPRTRNRRK
jgi:hypothetical protein